MITKHYDSVEEMMLRVRESKEAYAAKYLGMSFMDKLRVLVRLQKKAHFMGKLKVKPWPIDERNPLQ
jgi:hypothetical protein